MSLTKAIGAKAAGRTAIDFLDPLVHRQEADVIPAYYPNVPLCPGLRCYIGPV